MGIADTVGVKIEGDASGAIKASELSAEAIATATAFMKTRLKELRDSAKESMTGVGESSLKAANDVAESAGVIGAATEAMQLHMEGVQARYEAVTGAMGRLSSTMLGAMALLAGGEGFEKAIEASNDLAATNLKLSKTFGISLEQASGLHAALAKFGIDTDTVTGAVQKMDRQVRTHETTLNSMGMTTRDASGALLSQIDLFMNGLDTLRQYKEGTDRNIASQVLFGRGVGDVTSLLKLNRTELAEGLSTARELGLVTDQQGVESMKRYKIAINETKEVFEAIMVAIGSRVLPLFTELGEYIKNNGAVMMERLGAVLDVLGEAFTAVGRIVEAFAAVVTALYDNALAPLLLIADQLASKLRDTMAAAATFLMGHLDDLRAVASTLAGVLVTGLAAAVAYYATVTLTSAIPATVAFARALFTQVIPALYATITTLVTGIIPALGVLAEQLALNIFRMIALDAVNPAVWIGAAVAVVAALAAGFAAWLGWLDPIIAKMKELWSWTTKFLGLDKAFKAIAGAAAPAAVTPPAATPPGTKSAAGLITEPKEKKAKKEKKADEPTDEYMDWIKLRDELRKKSAKVQIDLADIEAKGEREAELAKIDADEDAAKHQYDIGNLTKRQLLQLEVKFAADRLAIQRKAIEDEIEAEKKGPNDPVKLAALQQQELAATRAFEKAKLKIENDADTERTAASRAATNSIATSWGTALAKMATLQAGFATTLNSMWGSIVNVVEQAIAKMVTLWIASIATKSAASAAFHAKEVLQDAKQAFSGAYKAVVGIPVIGPALAPIAGAAAFAGVMAFSAEGGWDVPASVGSGIDGRGGQIGIVHPREMILDEPAANALRKGGAGSHYHYHDHSGQATESEIAKRGRAYAKAIKSAWRGGTRP